MKNILILIFVIISYFLLLGFLNNSIKKNSIIKGNPEFFKLEKTNRVKGVEYYFDQSTQSIKLKIETSDIISYKELSSQISFYFNENNKYYSNFITSKSKGNILEIKIDSLFSINNNTIAKNYLELDDYVVEKNYLELNDSIINKWSSFTIDSFSLLIAEVRPLNQLYFTKFGKIYLSENYIGFRYFQGKVTDLRKDTIYKLNDLDSFNYEELIQLTELLGNVR
jgi:hypothetical protein